MKKFLALLLSVAMLLGACAFAEDAAPAGHNHRLSDLIITYGESTYDFSNFDFCLDVSPEGDAALLHMDVDGETAAELGFTKVDNLYAAHLAGTLTGHQDFVTDPVVQLAKALQGGIDGLIEMLQNVDSRELAEKIVNFTAQLASASQAEAEPEPTPEPTEEPAEATAEEGTEGETIVISLTDLSFEGDLPGLLESCITESEGEELDGSNGIPAGTYDVATFFADEETLAEVLNMVYAKGESLGLGDELLKSGLALGFSMTAYRGENVEATDATAYFDIEDASYNMHATAVLTSDETGETGTYNISGDQNGQPVGVSFTTFSGVSEDKSFSPASIDLANAINLDELSDEEAGSTLLGAFQTLMADAMLPLLGPIMDVAAANGDMDALMAAFDGAEGAPEEVPAA